MTEDAKAEFRVYTTTGIREVIPLENLSSWNLDYEHEIARFDYKDGSFKEFNKQYIVCVTLAKGELVDDTQSRQQRNFF